MKNFTFIFVSALFFLACSSDDDSHSPIITGNWKLMKIEVYSTDLEQTDYSNSKIIYHFRADDTLVVASDVENEGYGNGTYDYEINLEDFSGQPSSDESKEFVVLIEDNKWIANMSIHSMTLSQAHIDGPTLFFTKS